MNSYLIENEDQTTIKLEENNIIKKEKFTEATLNEYDLEETSISNALEDLDTYSFLSNKKVIIIKNIEILKSEENKKEIEHLLKYIDNPSNDNLLIIEAKKLNNTTKLAKDLKKKCTYIEGKIDSKKIIQNELKDYKIDNTSISYLIELCNDDLTKITNECNKLKNYKYEEKTITKEDIDTLVVKKLKDPKDLTFQFTRNIALKNKKEALKQYKELLDYNIEPISIIGLLASQIRIIYQVKILEKKRLSDKEIASTLEEKSDYRIKKTRELTNLYTEKELLELMQKLSQMDLKIKTEDVDANNLLELFIINI